MTLLRRLDRIMATLTQETSMHVVSRDDILGITNIPGINTGISSGSLSQAKLCLVMLTNSKRKRSSWPAFFKTVVLVSHVWRHFKIQADAYKTWQIYTSETCRLPMWQCELDPCRCCYIPPYAHQKIRGGRITDITSQITLQFSPLPIAKHDGWFPRCARSTTRKRVWGFKLITQGHKSLSLAIIAGRTMGVTANQSLRLPNDFSDLWIRFPTLIQAMTGSDITR